MKLNDAQLAELRGFSRHSGMDARNLLDTIDAMKAEHRASLAAFARVVSEHWPERWEKAPGDLVMCDCGWKSSTKKLDWREPEPEIHHGSIEWKQHIISLSQIGAKGA